MNSQNSRKIIVASGMAVVVVIALVTFALRSHPAASVAQTPLTPTPFAQTPADTPAAAAQIPPAPPGVAQTPDAPAAVAHTEFAASDSQITTDVKSEIAGDSLSKDANIGVTTTHGVVALTGNLASQDAIDHVKDVAGKVKDVKSVDASALILASL